MSWEDTIQDAKVGAGGARFEVGNHLVVVEEVKEVNNDMGSFFIVACEILESDTMSIGAKASKSIKRNGEYPKIPLGEIKAFAAAALGIDPLNEKRVDAEIVGDVIRSIKSDAQPVRGHILKARGYIKPPSAKSKPRDPSKPPFISVFFEPVLENGLPKMMQLPPLDRGGPSYGAQAAAQIGAPPPVYGAPPPPPPTFGAPPPPPPPMFPPAGWTQHPSSPTHYYKGQQVLSEGELRALASLGRA